MKDFVTSVFRDIDGEIVYRTPLEQPLPDIVLLDGRPYLRTNVGDGRALYVKARWISVSSTQTKGAVA